MQITRRQADEIHGALTQLAQHARGAKLCFAIAKNRTKLKGDVEALHKAGEPFEKARQALIAEHAKKDESGQPVNEDGQYVMADPAAWGKAFDALKLEHADNIAQVEELLDGIVDVDLHKIPASTIMADGAFAPDAPGLAVFFEPLLGTVIEE